VLTFENFWHLLWHTFSKVLHTGALSSTYTRALTYDHFSREVAHTFAKNNVYSGLSSKCTRALTFGISLFLSREDAAALARVNDLIRRHGVGAGPTWDAHAGGEEAEDGTITLTFSGLSNFLVGVALGGLLAGVIFRR
jgi:hypothetical protein